VTLREFAAALRAPLDPRSALFEHLRARIGVASDIPAPAASLDAVLLRGPWLLVLDGLDEVSAASSRDGVMAAVGAFLERYGAAPHLVVATSRPQGYGGELAGYTHLRLAPLSRARALWYAQDLVAQWYPDDASTRAKLLERLLVASRDGGTARLMQTPLQVTIMAALLLRIARAGVQHKPGRHWTNDQAGAPWA